MGTAGGFEKIGRKEEGEEEEKGDLKLEDYLSYDEMQISSLLSLSSPTFFINDGNRNNCASIAKEGTFQKFGVYVGLVGARFEKLQQMESQHMLCIDKIHTEGFFLKKNLSKTLLNKKRKKKRGAMEKRETRSCISTRRTSYGADFTEWKEILVLSRKSFHCRKKTRRNLRKVGLKSKFLIPLLSSSTSKSTKGGLVEK